MTTEDLYVRLGRMLEEGTLDRGAQVFAKTHSGELCLIKAIDPVNEDLAKAVVLPAGTLAFARTS